MGSGGTENYWEQGKKDLCHLKSKLKEVEVKKTEVKNMFKALEEKKKKQRKSLRT